MTPMSVLPIFWIGLAFLTESTISLTSETFLDRFGDNSSLSGLVSSPERYALALNLTPEEVLRVKEAHDGASEDLYQKLAASSSSDHLSGEEKHALLCEHRYHYGRHPFVCADCWCYRPVCLCGRLVDVQHILRGNIEVVVWTHHKEWGLTSNTGCLLPKMLSPCRILMKGLPQHDQILHQLLNDRCILPVVLWPSVASKTKVTGALDITLDKIESAVIRTSRQQFPIEGQNRRLVLVAVDGTWRNARRMVSRLPRTVARLDLPHDVVFPNKVSSPSSILAPLRSRGPNIEPRQVCTAEAVVRALVAVGGLPIEDAENVLGVVEKKVGLIRRYRGKVG